MTLRSTISTDAYTVFTSTDDFAEAVTYLPRSGAAREINAVVIRQSLQEETDGIVMPVFEVHVANDTTYGISGEELNVGLDQIMLPIRDGEDSVTKTIVHVITQDHGMLVLQVQ